MATKEQFMAVLDAKRAEADERLRNSTWPFGPPLLRLFAKHGIKVDGDTSATASSASKPDDAEMCDASDIDGVPVESSEGRASSALISPIVDMMDFRHMSTSPPPTLQASPELSSALLESPRLEMPEPVLVRAEAGSIFPPNQSSPVAPQAAVSAAASPSCPAGVSPSPEPLREVADAAIRSPKPPLERIPSPFIASATFVNGTPSATPQMSPVHPQHAFSAPSAHSLPLMPPAPSAPPAALASAFEFPPPPTSIGVRKRKAVGPASGGPPQKAAATTDRRTISDPSRLAVIHETPPPLPENPPSAVPSQPSPITPNAPAGAAETLRPVSRPESRDPRRIVSTSGLRVQTAFPPPSASTAPPSSASGSPGVTATPHPATLSSTSSTHKPSTVTLPPSARLGGDAVVEPSSRPAGPPRAQSPVTSSSSAPSQPTKDPKRGSLRKGTLIEQIRWLAVGAQSQSNFPHLARPLSNVSRLTDYQTLRHQTPPPIDQDLQQHIVRLLPTNAERLLVDWLCRFDLHFAGTAPTFEDMNATILSIDPTALQSMKLDPTETTGFQHVLANAVQRDVVLLWHSDGKRRFRPGGPVPPGMRVETRTKWLHRGIRFRPLIDLFNNLVLTAQSQMVLEVVDIEAHLRSIPEFSVWSTVDVQDYIRAAVREGVLIKVRSKPPHGYLLTLEYWHDAAPLSQFKPPPKPDIARPSIPEPPPRALAAAHASWPPQSNASAARPSDLLGTHVVGPTRLDSPTASAVSSASNSAPTDPGSNLFAFRPLVEALRYLFRFRSLSEVDLLGMELELNSRRLLHDGKIIVEGIVFNSTAQYLLEGKRKGIIRIVEGGQKIHQPDTWWHKGYKVSLEQNWRGKGELPK